MVVYHHNSRRKGGHRKQIDNWLSVLPGKVFAYYWRRWSNRTFFFVNCDRITEKRLEAFAARWKRHGKMINPQ